MKNLSSLIIIAVIISACNDSIMKPILYDNGLKKLEYKDLIFHIIELPQLPEPYYSDYSHHQNATARNHKSYDTIGFREHLLQQLSEKLDSKVLQLILISPKSASLSYEAFAYLADKQIVALQIENKGHFKSWMDKKRLLDYEYKGADGTGTVTWDDTIYFAEHDTDLIAPVKEIVNKLPATQYNDALLSLCKRAIGFKETQKEDYARLCNHRFGGYPDLPASIPYPRFGSNWHEEKADYLYEFIAQINCSEIAHLQDYLPRSGMLYFFLKTYHSVYDTPCPTQVIWYNGDAPLVSGTQFNFDEDDFYEVTSLPPYTPHKVDAFTMNSFPGLYSANQNPHWFATQRTQALSNIDFYDDIPFDMNDAVEEPISNLAPYNYAMNSYMFTQHESPELQAALKLKGNAQDWIVLLKVTSSSDFQWGDAGDLAFVIHKSDLAKGDFSNVFASIESS